MSVNTGLTDLDVVEPEIVDDPRGQTTSTEWRASMTVTGRGAVRLPTSPPVAPVGTLPERDHRTVAIVGTFPPTACGLATFTENVGVSIAAADQRWSPRFVRVVDRPEPLPSPQVVAHWIPLDKPSMRSAARTLNRSDAVLLQHEFGLFGGTDGVDVLALLDVVDTPVITVLHTVLEAPSPHQRKIVDELIVRSSALVVLSGSARDRLVCGHDVDPDAIAVIPHGAVANCDGSRPERMPHPTMITWGLVGPGKGIERGIVALAAMTDRLPELRYVIAGQTHPKVFERSGNRYRESLGELARELGVGNRVIFDDTYRSWDSLRALIRSMDLVLLPYDSRDQVTSGVLVEALASGKPVVATRFPHAAELLAAGAGIVVAHDDRDAMADAISTVLTDPAVQASMSRSAHAGAEPLLWPNVAKQFVDVLDSVVARTLT